MGCQSLTENQARLEGNWQLVAVNGEALPKLARGQQFSANFSGKGSASGSVACNRWHGQYEHNAEQIMVSKAATTRKACLLNSTFLSQLERDFLTSLQNARIEHLTHQDLVIKDAAGKTLSFVRQGQ